MSYPMSGGWSIYRNLDLNKTGVSVKGTRTEVGGWHISNSGSAIAYIKIYNKATAASATDTPVMTIPIPATTALAVEFTIGLTLAAGLSVRATTGVADNNDASPGANEVVANIFYS